MAPGRRRIGPLQPAGLSPANDDRQKDFRAFRQALNRARLERHLLGRCLLLSLAWLERRRRAWPTVLFGPDIWQIRTVEQLLAQP